MRSRAVYRGLGGYCDIPGLNGVAVLRSRAVYRGLGGYGDIPGLNRVAVLWSRAVYRGPGGYYDIPQVNEARYCGPGLFKGSGRLSRYSGVKWGRGIAVQGCLKGSWRL